MSKSTRKRHENNKKESTRKARRKTFKGSSNQEVRKPQRRLNTALLPPCRICGDKATGFHYGAITCEACKGFFHRSVVKSKKYECLGGETCHVYGRDKSQTKCPLCRLQRCLELGMSKEGTQIGRYTLEKRTQYILEAKGQSMASVVQDDHVSSNTTAANSPPNLESLTPPVQHTTQTSLQNEEFSSLNPCPNIINEQNQSSTHINSTIISSICEDFVTSHFIENPDNITPATNSTSTNGTPEAGRCTGDELGDLNINQYNTNRICSGIPLDDLHFELHRPEPDSSSRLKASESEMETVISILTSTFHIHFGITPEFLKQKALAEKKYVENLQLEREVFGEMRQLSLEEYLEIKAATGLEVDRRMALFRRMNEKADVIIKQIVHIARAIPHFQDLCTDDQLVVLKNMKAGAAQVINYQKHSTKLKVMHVPGTNLILPTDMLIKCYEPEAEDLFFQLIDRLYRIQLADDELVLTSCICLLLVDQYICKEPEKVMLCLDTCLDCLLVILRKNRPTERWIFPQIVSIITDYRTLETMRCEPKLMEKNFDIKLNEVYHELFK